MIKENLESIRKRDRMHLEDNLREIISYSREYVEINKKIQDSLKQLQNQLSQLKEVMRNDAVKCIEFNQIPQAKELLNKVERCEELQRILVVTKQDEEEKVKNNHDVELKKYSLDYDFQGKSVIAFEINGEKIKTSSWKDLLIKSCEYFLSNYEDEFIKMIKDEKIKGSTRTYLGFSDEGMRYPAKLSKYQITIETHHPTRDIIKIIKDTLKILKIESHKYTIYLKD